ncbi:peptidyl-prolyl cis-trans isomerase [Sorangium sp. So ce1036]|uniref:peptidylprolyl isomerase n=1 Tax=Sorangium sp. So ce1036 TaxID=3133328 RepID=UPI003F0E6A6D
MRPGRRSVAAAACVACVAWAALSTSASGAPTLRPDVAARVGAEEIPVALVGRIATAQRISPAQARDAAIRDALFAAEARARGLEQAPDVQREINAVLARRLLHHLSEEAANAGPVTDDELRVATERHWLELDRPEGYRTVHAVVRLAADADEVTRARAKEVAEAVRAAVASAREVALRSAPPPATGPRQPPPADPAADAFVSAAKGIPTSGLELVAEPLPPVTAAGRVLAAESQQFDPDFSRAAASLAARGDLSAPIPSRFGVHVIMLLERIPAQVVPAEERRRLVRDEVVTDRARAALARLLEGLRREPKVVGGFDALLELVRIEP